MHERIGREGIGICIQKWKMGRLHLDFVFPRDLLHRRLGSFKDWSKLIHGRRMMGLPPFFVVHYM